jgi:hypothetical protein
MSSNPFFSSGTAPAPPLPAPARSDHDNGHSTDAMLEQVYAFWPGLTPAAPPCPEATFSLTIRGKLDGQETLLTVRGQSASEFQANLAAVRGLLDQPQPQPTPQAASPQRTGVQDIGWCQKHGVEMTLNTKENRQWWSHFDQAAGRWCKGR